MISIQVSNKKQNQRFEHSGGPLEFGRGPRRTAERFVLNDIFASRDQLRIEELPHQRLRIENLSLKQEIGLGDEHTLTSGASEEVPLPVRLSVGQSHLDVEWVPVDAFDRSSLLHIDSGIDVADTTRAVQALSDLGDEPTPEALVQWLETALALQRSATNSREFYDRTVRALVRLVGLDLGMILLRRDWTWEVVARHTTDAAGSVQFSPALLSHVVAERRTVYQDMSKAVPPGKGLQGVDAVVVAPVFGLHDDMMGALYGLRNPRFPARGGKITPLEAQMVQLLAATVGGHLGRAQAAKTRVAYEQFFSPKVMRELERDPTLLEGRSQEVTLLVSGLHDFATVAERLGPQHTCRLVRDMLERQAEKVVEAGGVIVEYNEAGMVALWNAPARQHDHPLLASGAALAMLAEIPEIAQRWQAQVGGPLNVGIGLHTGTVQVGSMGSSHKFKYAPYGPTWQLAAQVRATTHVLGKPLVLTGATRDRLPDTFAARRLGQARFGGTAEPVVLYELHGVSAAPEWIAWRDAYENALDLYEAGQWAHAAQALLPLVAADAEADLPSVKLMRQAWQCVERLPNPFDPTLDVTGVN